MYAQDDAKFGTDPETCKMNLSLYSEFYKQKNYVDALTPWRSVFNTCPESSKNIYIHGVRIISEQIDKAKEAKNLELKNKYIDTLMMVYDQRIKYFGQEADVLERKAVDLFKNDESRFEESYNMLLKAIDINKEKTGAAASLGFMQISVLMMNAQKIDKGVVVENYSKAAEAVEASIKEKPDDADLVKVKESIEALFVSVGPDCDVIISLFQPKFEANPENLDLLKNITKVLKKQSCTESKLFFDASEKLYSLEPSAEAASNLAQMAVKKGELSKASKFYLQAIELQQDANEKAQYYLELANLNKDLGQLAQARTYAFKAAELRANWGMPYLLIGTMYASSSKSCGENDFEQKAVFWVALDKFYKAKAIDPSIAESANKLINTYSQYIPDKENAFFYNYTEGQSYTVGCWINESTTIRF
ncbi:MAG TPA: hypothetical protein DDX39_07025 [Bacteroidales bacterium]|nr:hypothetical protein [Bacteroidales bacterium]